jgi:hypothetical protein
MGVSVAPLHRSKCCSCPSVANYATDAVLPPAASPSCAAVSRALSLSGLAGTLVAAHLPQLAALRLKNQAVDGWGRGKGGMGRVWVTTFAEDPNDNVRQSPHARHAPVLGLILSQRRSAATSSHTEASRP